MLKSKVAKKAEPTANTKAAKSAKKGGDKYGLQIEKLREEIKVRQEEIKGLLIKQFGETNPGWEVGSTVYYPAPPQKKVIPCILELEEDADHTVTFFVRPIVNKKDGTTEMSKRHYSVGTDLDHAEGLSKTAPKMEKKTVKKEKPEKATVKISTEEEAPAPKSTKSKIVDFPVKKKPVLGKKKK